MTARRRALTRAIGTAASYAVLLVAAFLALFPLFWTISTSIKSRADTFVLPPRYFDFEPTLRNY